MLKPKEIMTMDEVSKSILHLKINQIELFFSFGLRQAKWFFETDYPPAVKALPMNAEIEGVNFFGRIQARDTSNKIRYGFFPHNHTWSESLEYEGGGKLISLDDLKALYHFFGLENYTLDALTHIPKQYKEHYISTSTISS